MDLIKSKGGNAFFIKANTSKPFDSLALVNQTVNHFNRLDIACNVAGFCGPVAMTGDYPVDGWDKVISANLSGVFYGLRYQIPAMLDSGGGTIVNIAANVGLEGIKFSPAFVAAKHGLVGLTKTAALEYADRKIRINTIGPGYIINPSLTHSISEASMESFSTLHPAGKHDSTNEVAELALWLGSPKSSFVTGSYYTVDGGYRAE